MFIFNTWHGVEKVSFYRAVQWNFELFIGRIFLRQIDRLKYNTVAQCVILFRRKIICEYFDTLRFIYLYHKWKFLNSWTQQKQTSNWSKKKCMCIFIFSGCFNRQLSTFFYEKQYTHSSTRSHTHTWFYDNGIVMSWKKVNRSTSVSYTQFDPIC